MSEESSLFGLNVIGFASANVGLGNTVRQFVDCFHARGEKIRILDINTIPGNTGFDKSLEEWFVLSASDLPYAINLSIFGATHVVDFISNLPDGLQFNDRLNVGFVWWELTSIPQYMIDAMKVFDVLVAGSDFIHSTLSNNINGIPILRASHPVSISEDIRSNRKRFKLPENRFIAFMGFDPHSNINRKNPYAAIEAFKLAFPDCPDCHLAIKVNYSGGGGIDLEDSLNRLRAYVDSDSRIQLIQESLTYYDLLCLYASCDVFISLHRAEGLGLVPLEAMRLGKPVVATAWSGNMSFMNYCNACLVESNLIPIEASTPTYGSDSLGIKCKWAEPDIKQAAAWLRKLFDDPEFRLQLGLRAVTDSNKYHEQARKAEFIDELKVIWENRELLPKRNRGLLINQARDSKRRFEYEKYLSKMSPIDKIVHKVKKELDRHLLWRFRKNKV
jgi:glycosyltransferase involved in cell wall biosynthesis